MARWMCLNNCIDKSIFQINLLPDARSFSLHIETEYTQKYSVLLASSDFLIVPAVAQSLPPTQMQEQIHGSRYAAGVKYTATSYDTLQGVLNVWFLEEQAWISQHGLDSWE